MDSEWELSKIYFNNGQKKFGPFTIDLFASRINKKCETFCSRFANPDTSFVDEFTIPWNNTNFFGFPPFFLILKALRKIIIDKAAGVMIVPKWSTRS